MNVHRGMYVHIVSTKDKRRYSGRRFVQSSSFQSYGDGGLGNDCCGAAGYGGNRVFDRPRGGPTNTGPCNVASLPQSR